MAFPLFLRSHSRLRRWLLGLSALALGCLLWWWEPWFYVLPPSNTRWRAEIAAIQHASTPEAALPHCRRAIFEAKKFGRHDWRLADSDYYLAVKLIERAKLSNCYRDGHWQAIWDGWGYASSDETFPQRIQRISRYVAARIYLVQAKQLLDQAVNIRIAIHYQGDIDITELLGEFYETFRPPLTDDYQRVARTELPYLDRMIAHLVSQDGPPDSTLVKLCADRAELYLSIGYPEKTNPSLELAYTTLHRLHELNDREIFYYLDSVAGRLRKQKRYPEAIRCYQESIKAHQKNTHLAPFSLCHEICRLAEIYLDEQQNPKARALLDELLAQHFYGDTGYWLPNDEELAGQIYLRLGDRNKAKSLWIRAILDAIESTAGSPFDWNGKVDELDKLVLSKGDPAAEAGVYEKILASLQRPWGANCWQVAEFEWKMADMYQQCGNERQASRYRHYAKAMYQQLHHPLPTSQAPGTSLMAPGGKRK